MSIEFSPVRQEPAYRKVADAIAARIVDRSLRDGDPLPPETLLAEQFGVNRGTVREALRELESGGLVARRRGTKRLVVSRPEPAAMADGISRALLLHDVTALEVWEAMMVIEPPIADSAARRRTPTDIEQLQRAARQFRDGSEQAERAVQHVANFFRRVAAASHNRVLALAQEPLVRLLEPTLQLMIDRVPQARSRILQAHQKITEAIEAQDVTGAATWMTRHIRDFRRGYEVAGIEFESRVVLDAAQL